MRSTSTPNSSSANYSFRVAGRLGPTTLSAFPAFLAEGAGSDTVLIGPVADCAALYGIVNQMESLGLELIEVRRRKSPSIESGPNRPPELEGC
jgi:hypothetical protein